MTTYMVLLHSDPLPRTIIDSESNCVPIDKVFAEQLASIYSNTVAIIRVKLKPQRPIVIPGGPQGDSLLSFGCDQPLFTQSYSPF